MIAGFDARLSQHFKLLYNRTIDFGGHPNPSGTLNAIKLEKEKTSISYTTLALVTEELPLLHALENTRQVGLAVLFVFQHIFKQKFELLGIRKEMDAKRRADHLRCICYCIGTLTVTSFYKPGYATNLCRSPIETSPASPIEMSRSSVCLRLVE